MEPRTRISRHQPVRRPERNQQRFKSPGSAQPFLSIHSATCNTYYHQRHLLKRSMDKELRTRSFEVWQSASVAA
jgi:transposase-like protein